MYSAHDYGISVYDHQDWFDLVKHPEFPANLPAVWDHFWGYIYKQNIAPVLIGEFGSTLADARDVQWLNKLVSYMGTGSSGMSFTYWSWNPDSGDTGGIVKDDWVTVQTAKQSILQPALVPPVPSGVTPTPTPTPTPPPTPTPTPTPSGAKSCTATFSVVNSWQGGFQAGVTVKAGSAAIASWSTSFTMSATVSNLWSGTLSSSGSSFTVKNAAWNGAVAAGQSTSFGFVASGTAPTGTVAVTCTAG